MNMQQLVEDLYKNLSFIDTHSKQLYQQHNLTKNQFVSLCLHPNPYRIPKHRKILLYKFYEKLQEEKQKILGGTDELINEKIIMEQRISHERERPLFLRKRWMEI